MADNVVANAGSGGATFAADDVGGVLYPRSKSNWGPDGTSNDTDVAAGKAFPVQLRNTSGTEIATSGAPLRVDPTGSTTQPISDAGGSITIDDGSGSITVDGSVTAVSATAANFKAQVQGEAAHDAAASGNPILLGAYASASAPTDVSTDGDAVRVWADKAGRVQVGDGGLTLSIDDGGGNISIDDGGGSITVDGTVAVTGTFWQATQPVSIASVPSHAVTNAGTFATQVDGAALTSLQLIDNLVLAEDSAHVSGDPGVLGFAVRRDANTSLVDATGDYAPLQVDATGSLKVAIISGAGSGGTSATDDAAFSVASGAGTPIMGLADETSPDSVDEGDVGVVRMTLTRALHVNLRDSSGNELSAGAQYAEDAVHTTGDSGTLSLVVRKDTAAQVAGTDGDYSALVNDASGRLHVNVGAVPADPFGVNADAASATGSISAKLRFIAATGIPITGTVTVGSHAVTNAGTFAVQAGQAAHDAAITGSPVRTAGRAGTADFTAVADGDTTDILTTILGKQVMQPYALPANTWNYAAPAGGLVTTTGVTAKAAAGANIRNYVTKAQIMNSHQTIGSEIVIRDGAAGTVLWRGWAQFTGGGCECKFEPPLRGTANTLIEIAEVTTTGTAGVLVNLQGYSAAE